MIHTGRIDSSTRDSARRATTDCESTAGISMKCETAMGYRRKFSHFYRRRAGCRQGPQQNATHYGSRETSKRPKNCRRYSVCIGCLSNRIHRRSDRPSPGSKNGRHHNCRLVYRHWHCSHGTDLQTKARLNAGQSMPSDAASTTFANQSKIFSHCRRAFSAHFCTDGGAFNNSIILT